MDEIDEFISILNAECEWLKNNGYMQKHIEEGWRFYSLPLCGEPDDDRFQAVFEAGRIVCQAEKLIKISDEAGAKKLLASARGVLLKPLCAHGRRHSKLRGNSKGGSSKDEKFRELIFEMAEDLMLSGQPRRGLASKVAWKLSEKGQVVTDQKINNIIDKLIQDGKLNVS